MYIYVFLYDSIYIGTWTSAIDKFPYFYLLHSIFFREIVVRNRHPAHSEI